MRVTCKKTYFEEHLLTVPSNDSNRDYPNIGCFKKSFHAYRSPYTMLTKSFLLKRLVKLYALP